MAIRRPSHMVLKASKTGKVKVVYESEHKYLSEDYQRLHGGFLLTSETLDDDGLIVPSRQNPEKIEGEVLKHVGPVPLPRNVSHPWEFVGAPYGTELAEHVTVEEDSTTGERIVTLPARLLADVLEALDAAEKE